MKQPSQPQPYTPEKPPRYSSNDEIDLRELFQALWNGKVILIMVTAIFAVGSVIFALSQQEWWTSSAKISMSQPQDLTKYQQQVKQFQPLFDIYQDDGTVLISSELGGLIDPKVLFDRFISAFNSSNNKRAFLDSNSEFKTKESRLSNETSDTSEQLERVVYSEWFKRITASAENSDVYSTPYFVSFQTTTKIGSFNLLTAYISEIETKVRQDAFNNLRAVVSSKQNELVQQKKVLERQAKNQLLVEIERAKYATLIARSAGVNKPIQIGDNNEIFGIDLGAEALEAKVQALESVKNLSVIELRLQQINAKLGMLNGLKIDRTIEFKPFRFLENVEQPITRDKPKRALIVVLGTLLGGMLGVEIVLVRFAFRKED